MKYLKIYEDFLFEKKKSVKSKLKKINKKIVKAFDDQKEFIKTAKEMSDSDDPSGKMQSSLAKVQMRQSEAEAERLMLQKQAEVLKSKIKTAKDREAAKDDLDESNVPDGRVDLKDEDEKQIKIRHFQGSVQDLDDWLRDKIGETNPYKDTIMVNGPHKGKPDKSLPYQDFQNGESDLVKNRHGRNDI